MVEKTFDPNEHLMYLTRWTKDEKGKSVMVKDEYLEVKWRLVWFRNAYPQGTIETQEMVVDLDKEVTVTRKKWNDSLKRNEEYTVTGIGYARIKAIVKTGEGGIATGTKTETAVDFPDFVEKAETGAIGRALAALGFGTQFTGGELDEGTRIVDSPVPAKQEDPKPAATVDQMRTIRQICNQLKQPLPAGMKDFSPDQASEAIDQLKKQLREKRAQPETTAS